MRVTQTQCNTKLRKINNQGIQIGKKNKYVIKGEKMSIEYGEGDYGEELQDFDATMLLKYMTLGETAEFYCQHVGVS